MALGETWPLLEPEVDLAGEYAFMFRWLGFALEVNYGDFLGENGLGLNPGGVLATIHQKTAQTPLSPSASTSDGKRTAS